MNRIKFLNKLDLKYQEMNIAEEYGDEFKRFYILSERDPEMVGEYEQFLLDEMRTDFELNDVYREKYRIWHLLKHFSTKWRGQTVDDIVNKWYSKGVMVKELLDE